MGLTERSKALYHPWSQEGFNADLFVRKMTNVQRWIYKTLLQEAFVCSTRPKLPNDDELLWIMADCESKEQWIENKEVVLKMFKTDGDLLVHPRLEEDWGRLQEIRETRSEAGKKGGLAKAKQKLDPAKQNVASKEVSKEVSEVSKESEEEDSDMKLKDELTRIAARHGAKAGGYKTTWDEIKTLGVAHGTGAVATDFSNFMEEYHGDDFPSGAVVSYLRVAQDRLVADSGPVAASAKDPEVVGLVRELTYASDGVVAFMDKQRVRLAEVLKEFSAAEIKSVFAAWFSDQDLSDPKNVSYLPGKFVQIVDGLAYAARKKKEETEKTRTLRDETAQRLQKEAEAEREKQAEEVIPDFDPLA